MQRRFHAELIIEFDFKEDHTSRDAARFIASVVEDKFDGDNGEARLLDCTVTEEPDNA